MADKAGAVILDFSDVKDGGGAFNKKRVPAGDYLAKITKVEDRPTKETKEAQWLFTIELQEKYTDRKFPFYCKLVPNQLWKVRNLFIAAGLSIPKKKVKLDPNKVVGRLIGVTLEDDEYEGKAQSVVAQTFPANELDGDTEPEDDETTDDEEYEEPEDDAEETEDEEDSEETDEDEEDEEEEEEEPEPAPKKRAATKIPAQRKSSPATRRKAPAAEVDEDELEELDIDSI